MYYSLLEIGLHNLSACWTRKKAKGKNRRMGVTSMEGQKAVFRLKIGKNGIPFFRPDGLSTSEEPWDKKEEN